MRRRLRPERSQGVKEDEDSDEQKAKGYSTFQDQCSRIQESLPNLNALQLFISLFFAVVPKIRCNPLLQTVREACRQSANDPSCQRLAATQYSTSEMSYCFRSSAKYSFNESFKNETNKERPDIVTQDF